MVTDRVWVRHEDAGHLYMRNLGDGDRSGSPDKDVGARIYQIHPVQVRQHQHVVEVFDSGGGLGEVLGPSLHNQADVVAAAPLARQ